MSGDAKHSLASLKRACSEAPAGVPKMLHMSKGAQRRLVKCDECEEERWLVLAPKAKIPARCIVCSRKRAASIWNGRMNRTAQDASPDGPEDRRTGQSPARKKRDK